MNTPKWIVILALVFALAMPATPVSAAPATSIRLTPPTPNLGLIGDDINFALVVDVTDIVPGVAGVEIYLAYDPLFVAPSSSPLGVVEPVPDFFGPSNITWYEILPKEQCPPPAGGPLPCIHLVAAGPAQVTHSGAVARFHFQGIKVTPVLGTAFTVLVTPKMVVNADGFPVVPVVIAPPVSVKIVDRMVTGVVLRQGTPAIPAGSGTPACSEVRLISGGVTFGPVFTDGAGAFTLTNPPSGVQTLRAEYPGYLASQKTITISTGGPSSINVGATTLRGGDVNDDDKINILDIGTIISKIGSAGVPVRSDPAEGCADPDEPADINDDGKVDISDLGLLYGSNFGLAGPTVWP